MIVRDVLNTRPPDQIAAWLDGLGSFDLLTPHDAADRWGVDMRQALERLHYMVGTALEVPAGKVEVYRRGEWMPAPETASMPDRGNERDIRRMKRLSQIPERGAPRRELREIWDVSESNFEEIVKTMVRRGLIARTGKIWRRI